MTSEHDLDRHKSKFNGRGKKNKEKKKKRHGKKNKIRPGSEEELTSLVSTLKSCCIDEEYAATISATTLFLSQVGRTDLSQQVFDNYEELRKALAVCQSDRIQDTMKNRLIMERKARMEGMDHPPITLSCEAEVDVLQCAALSGILADFFEFFA
jgi:hypothetical protein